MRLRIDYPAPNLCMLVAIACTMPAESELVDPLCDWFRREYGGANLLLIHEEPQGRGGRRPDLLVVSGAIDSTSIEDVVMIPVEIVGTLPRIEW